VERFVGAMQFYMPREAVYAVTTGGKVMRITIVKSEMRIRIDRSRSQGWG
jgi:hypothetical protein